MVFVCSTTGQGETPDNMKARRRGAARADTHAQRCHNSKTCGQTFWRFLLRKDLPADSLETMQFAVFGLGDSSYPIYNAVARRLHARLQDLGAKPVVRLGLGDDQHALG